VKIGTFTPSVVDRSQRVDLGFGGLFVAERAPAEEVALPALVLLHDLFLHHHAFARVAAALAAARRVLAPDLPGCGDSDAPPPAACDDYRPRWIARVLLECLEARQVGEVDLLAHGFGALVAAHLGELLGDRLRRLIVVAAPGGSGAPLGLLGRLPGFASRVLPRLATRDLLRRYLERAQASSSSSIDEGALALYWDRLARPGGVEAAMAMLGHLGEPGLGERLAALRRRALVVWGSDDRLCPLVGGRRLADALGAHLVVLDRCGHLPAEEAPEALVECVDAFLAEAAPRAP